MEGFVVLLLLVVVVINAVRMHNKKSTVKRLNSELAASNSDLQNAHEQIAFLAEFHDRYKRVADSDARLEELNADISEAMVLLSRRRDELQQLTSRLESTQKKLAAAENRVLKLRDAYDRIRYSIESYDSAPDLPSAGAPGISFEDITSIAPVTINALSIKELRSRYRANEKSIRELVAAYAGRYTTKANEAVYKLMVLGMEAELQNIIFMMKFGKLEDAVDKVKQLTAKYYTIAVEGNQVIAGTLTKFIAQLEYQYIQAVSIEYEYYLKREAAREQQRALKEQMRQEAAERERLELERKKVDGEEAKYRSELERLAQMLAAASAADSAALNARIAQLEAQLSSVEARKSEIINLQNGKAGTVYIISNLGAFGDHVFKIGMTRRLEPQDRIDELGSASVPFPFDVHSFIFSNDAVALESALHRELNDRRVNKVNLRKEFFDVSLPELQSLVERIDPTAPFHTTFLAEQYNQSQSIASVPYQAFLSDDEYSAAV